MPDYTFSSVTTNLATLLSRQFDRRPPPGDNPVTVDTKIPAHRDLAAARPLVVLTQDGAGQVRQRIHQLATVRALAWSSQPGQADEDATDDLIQYVHAVLTGYAGDRTIRAIRPQTAPWIDTDPDTGHSLGAFTCDVHQVAQVLPRLRGNHNGR